MLRSRRSWCRRPTRPPSTPRPSPPFSSLFESEPYTAALAFFAAPAAGPGPAVAKHALMGGIAHIEKDIADYERAQMGSRARTCRERLKQVQDALARFK